MNRPSSTRFRNCEPPAFGAYTRPDDECDDERGLAVLYGPRPLVEVATCFHRPSGHCRIADALCGVRQVRGRCHEQRLPFSAVPGQQRSRPFPTFPSCAWKRLGAFASQLGGDRWGHHHPAPVATVVLVVLSKPGRWGSPKPSACTDSVRKRGKERVRNRLCQAAVKLAALSLDTSRGQRPAVPEEIRSAARFGDRLGDGHSAGNGAQAAHRLGSHGGGHYLQPDPLRKRQADRRMGMPRFGLHPGTSPGSKGKPAEASSR